ncbi:hypothetical protein QBC38DRAFT_549541 [Podospora fimiseda]|uniref:Uncharacterized protein n=1 Tax=Podospora fimiseda TaxID=252190 RepID=A0AAN6YP37_9PEZI|nr:hypothetical protein QBC38DRAFT_549541 [Podospora fimiseda]
MAKKKEGEDRDPSGGIPPKGESLKSHVKPDNPHGYPAPPPFFHNRSVPNWDAAKHSVQPDGKTIFAAGGLRMNPRILTGSSVFPHPRRPRPPTMIWGEDGEDYLRAKAAFNCSAPQAPTSKGKQKEKGPSRYGRPAFNPNQDVSSYEGEVSAKEKMSNHQNALGIIRPKTPPPRDTEILADNQTTPTQAKPGFKDIQQTPKSIRLVPQDTNDGAESIRSEPMEYTTPPPRNLAARPRHHYSQPILFNLQAGHPIPPPTRPPPAPPETFGSYQSTAGFTLSPPYSAHNMRTNTSEMYDTGHSTYAFTPATPYNDPDESCGRQYEYEYDYNQDSNYIIQPLPEEETEYTFQHSLHAYPVGDDPYIDTEQAQFAARRPLTMIFEGIEVEEEHSEASRSEAVTYSGSHGPQIND